MVHWGASDLISSDQVQTTHDYLQKEAQAINKPASQVRSDIVWQSECSRNLHWKYGSLLQVSSR